MIDLVMPKVPDDNQDEELVEFLFETFERNKSRFEQIADDLQYDLRLVDGLVFAVATKISFLRGKSAFSKVNESDIFFCYCDIASSPNICDLLIASEYGGIRPTLARTLTWKGEDFSALLSRNILYSFEFMSE